MSIEESFYTLTITVMRYFATMHRGGNCYLRAPGLTLCLGVYPLQMPRLAVRHFPMRSYPTTLDAFGDTASSHTDKPDEYQWLYGFASLVGLS